ncbi:MAG: hypothetical protein EA360_00655 [Balneolaceae bacterium]|nr:MAG: hypothetical protein EA360_00655 [Balneolaceae bacterium]
MTDLYHYRLPFAEPLRTANKTIADREGLILRFRTREGEWCSEIAPLPGFSDETLAGVQDALATILPLTDQFFSNPFTRDELQLFLDSLPRIASLQCGLSYLGILILAFRIGTSPMAVLSDTFSETVGVNGMTGAEEPEKLRQSLNLLAGAGFKTLKVKAPWPLNALVEILTALQTEFPDLRFRPDANRSWPADAVPEACRLLEPLHIQYIEEPSPADSPGHFLALASQCCLPLAADETVADMDALSAFLQNSPDTFLILKPMLTGSLLKLSEMIDSSRPDRKGVVITSALETSLGREMAILAASALGDPQLDHGLNTGTLFRDDLMKTRPQNQPRMVLNLSSDTRMPFDRLNHQFIKKMVLLS